VSFGGDFTGIRKFTEVLACSGHVSLVCGLFGRVTPNVSELSTYSDRRLPPPLLWITPLKTGSGAFPSPAVGGVILTVGNPKINNPIIPSIPIDVIQPASRHLAIHPKPREAMQIMFLTVYEDEQIAVTIRRSCNRSGWSHAIWMASPNLPDKNSGLWIVVQKLLQTTDRNCVRKFVPHGRVLSSSPSVRQWKS
jgi:hypothetical protein